MKKPTAMLALALSLGGCSAIPISTQWKLRNFDLGVADLSKIRFAVRPPDAFQATPDQAELDFSVALTGAQNESRDLKIRLRRAHHFEDGALLREAAKGARLDIYEIAPQSLAAAIAMQQWAMARKAAGGHGNVSVKAAGQFACRKPDSADGPILIDVYIHADDATGWAPLLLAFDARALANPEEWRQKLDELAPLCAAPKQR